MRDILDGECKPLLDSTAKTLLDRVNISEYVVKGASRCPLGTSIRLIIRADILTFCSGTNNKFCQEGLEMNTKEALELAIEEELKARERYKELAKQAGDPETRLMFEQLAREEDNHYKRLSDRLKAIKLMGQ